MLITHLQFFEDANVIFIHWNVLEFRRNILTIRFKRRIKREGAGGIWEIFRQAPKYFQWDFRAYLPKSYERLYVCFVNGTLLPRA